MAWPELDWSHNVRDLDGELDDPFHYDTFDKHIGHTAFSALEQLSIGIATLEADEHGWTSAEYRALYDLALLDHEAGFMVPPSTTPLEHRFQYGDRMAALHAALPLSEAEGRWLFGGDKAIGGRRGVRGELISGQAWGETARTSEAELVSDGVLRRVHGRDLMQRWWSWRRELGEYVGGAGLNQARGSLDGLIRLLAPELGLPESYVALRHTEGD
jgi:hypothetical protein